jgi:hypothetical protein
VGVREHRHGDQGSAAAEAFIERLQTKVQSRSLA